MMFFWLSGKFRYFLKTAGFEVCDAVKIRVELFWAVMPCSVAKGYQRFWEPYCLLQMGVSQPRRPRLDS